MANKSQGPKRFFLTEKTKTRELTATNMSSSKDMESGSASDWKILKPQFVPPVPPPKNSKILPETSKSAPSKQIDVSMQNVNKNISTSNNYFLETDQKTTSPKESKPSLKKQYEIIHEQFSATKDMWKPSRKRTVEARNQISQGPSTLPSFVCESTWKRPQGVKKVDSYFENCSVAEANSQTKRGLKIPEYMKEKSKNFNDPITQAADAYHEKFRPSIRKIEPQRDPNDGMEKFQRKKQVSEPKSPDSPKKRGVKLINEVKPKDNDDVINYNYYIPPKESKDPIVAVVDEKKAYEKKIRESISKNYAEQSATYQFLKNRTRISSATLTDLLYEKP